MKDVAREDNNITSSGSNVPSLCVEDINTSHLGEIAGGRNVVDDFGVVRIKSPAPCSDLI